MFLPALRTSTKHPVRRLRSTGPMPKFVPGEVVQFHVDEGLVQGTVTGVDPKARRDLPLGLPYGILVTHAPPHSGYLVGGEYTIRAGCLELEGGIPRLPVPEPPAPAPALPFFLVAWMREGSNVPTQGTMLVQGASLEVASAAAMAALTAELQADVAERGESPEAMVLLLNAAEVPRPEAGVPVVASVSW
ncbi:MAG: hypothetical protein ACK5XT_01735 [Gemmatimonas sp.]|uniref:hypothetical protein n=1 Tax=Gemmatimonas sp. TaxID=1962908 RepID=UPI00391F5559|nr:hypothetical protein [Gemmatimonadota bacterium]